jgi:hypothetical protein
LAIGSSGKTGRYFVIGANADYAQTLPLGLAGSNRKFKSQKAMIYKQLCELLKELSTSKLADGECLE